MSNSTVWPSLRVLYPSPVMLEKWTNTSSPSSREMKPKPFSALKNFTVPVANALSSLVRADPRDQLARPMYRTGFSLLVAVGDPTAVEVVGGHLDLDPVSRQDPDAVLAHLAAQMTQHRVAVVERDAEMSPLEGFFCASFKDEGVVFGLRQSSILVLGSQSILRTAATYPTHGRSTR